jgi:hypothetical protein
MAQSVSILEPEGFRSTYRPNLRPGDAVAMLDASDRRGAVSSNADLLETPFFSEEG